MNTKMISGATLMIIQRKSVLINNVNTLYFLKMRSFDACPVFGQVQYLGNLPYLAKKWKSEVRCNGILESRYARVAVSQHDAIVQLEMRIHLQYTAPVTVCRTATIGADAHGRACAYADTTMLSLRVRVRSLLSCTGLNATRVAATCCVLVYSDVQCLV